MSAAAGAQARPAPIATLIVVSIALVFGSAVYLGAYFPRTAPLVLPSLLVVLAGLCLGLAVALLRRLQPFAWWRFRQVAGWVLLAYLVIGGLLEFVTVSDGARGDLLLLASATLVLFALDVPILLGYSVARYQSPEQLPG